MSYRYTFQTQGVCSKEIEIELEGNIIKSIQFIGGCSGNQQGIARLAKGMTVEEYIKKCAGIQCGSKPTSCPDQLAIALEEALVVSR